MDSKIPCNLCGNLKVRNVIKPERKAAKAADIFSAAGGIRGTQNIVKCNICGLVFVSPRFSRNEVVKAYSEGSDHGYASQTRGRVYTFGKAMQLITKNSPKKGRLLDVGCANGGFLLAAKKKGFKVVGVEPSLELVKDGRKKGLKIIQGTLSGAGFKSASFDIVTYWDVLEHISDPFAELKEAYRVLKPGGLLLVNYPDYGSLLSKLSGKYWWFLLSVHLYYFNKGTLEKFLIKSGFIPFIHKKHFQYLEIGYLAQMFSIYNKPISKIAGFLIKIFGMSKLLIPYYASQKTVLARKNYFS